MSARVMQFSSYHKLLGSFSWERRRLACCRSGREARAPRVQSDR